MTNKREDSFLSAAKESLLNDFPNPERNGCPNSETIKAIAFGRIKGEQARRWRVHAATCSPCVREYVAFRKNAERARRVRAAGLIAAAAVLIVIIGWAVLAKLGVPLGHGVVAWAEGWQQASLDLRGHEALRGGEPGPQLSPLVLPRGKLALTIDLPVGGEPGKYDVQVQQPRGQPVAQASGTANLMNGLTVLKLRVDTRHAHAGTASLRVHPPERSWSRYAITVR